MGGSHSLTLTSKASVQHVQVVSHLYVCKKFRVEGSFHILLNPAVDRWFKYVLRKKIFLGLLFLHSSSHLAKLASFTLLTCVTPIRNVNISHDVTHFVKVAAHASVQTCTRGPVDRVTYGMCS